MSTCRGGGNQQGQLQKGDNVFSSVNNPLFLLYNVVLVIIVQFMANQKQLIWIFWDKILFKNSGTFCPSRTGTFYPLVNIYLLVVLYSTI